MRHEFIVPVDQHGVQVMKSVFLWLLGVPIGVIILMNVFHVI